MDSGFLGMGMLCKTCSRWTNIGPFTSFQISQQVFLEETLRNTAGVTHFWCRVSLLKEKHNMENMRKHESTTGSPFQEKHTQWLHQSITSWVPSPSPSCPQSNSLALATLLALPKTPNWPNAIKSRRNWPPQNLQSWGMNTFAWFLLCYW